MPDGASLVNRFTGQMGTDRLPISEQLGFGGYSTVRGYDEREVNTDEGFMATVELRSPMIDLEGLGRKSRVKDRIQFLVFWDYGKAVNHTRLEGEDKVVELHSVGVGLRYRIGAHLSVRLDYGYRLKDTGGDLDNDCGRFHLGIVATSGLLEDMTESQHPVEPIQTALD